MENASFRPKAILLIGPTGVGKTPLGDALEASELDGRRWFHFDFGQNLRTAAACPESFPFLDEGDAAVIRNSLETGALLEDSQFHIVEALFRSFCAARGMGPEDGVVLNGMPRHAGQAERMGALTAVAAVVHLDCDEETVLRRIASNAGGDRTDRVDDDATFVAGKLRTFRERTMPLLTYYRGLSPDPVMTVSVGLETRPVDIVEKLREFLENLVIS